MIHAIKLSAECISDCSHPADHLARFLGEYGAWDAEELADDEANRRRILWVAACHCRETHERVFYID